MSYHTRLLLVCLALGCAATAGPEDDGAGSAGGKADGVVVEGEYYDTRNTGAQLLETWHALHDEIRTTSCLDVVTSQPVTTGDQDIEGAHMFVSSRQQLARELGVSLSAEGTIQGVEGKASARLLRKFSANRRTRTFFLKARVSFDAETNAEVDLKPEKAAMLADGRDGVAKFVRDCGTHYLSGVRHAAELYVMITYTAANEEAATEFEAEVSASSGDRIPGADVSAELGSKLTSLAQREDIEARVELHAQGFTLRGTQVDSTAASGLIGSEVNEETFARIRELTEAMGRSISLDKDAVDNNPDASVSTRTTAVSPASYEGLPSWPRDVELDEVEEAILENQAWLDSLEELMETMSTVYWDEIAPFSANGVGDHDRAAYNVAIGRLAHLADRGDDRCNPEVDLNREGCFVEGVPSSLQQLGDINGFWAYQFYPGEPTTSEQVGAAFLGLRTEYEACFLATQNDPFHLCGEVRWQPDNEAVAGARELLTEYHKSGRLLPIRYWASDDAQSVAGKWTFGRGALGVCQNHRFRIGGDVVYGDLPSREEARYLAPLVGWGPIDWNDSSIARAIWYQESTEEEECGPGEAGVMVRPRDPDQEPYIECFAVGDWDAWNPWAEEIVALCIPSSGAIAEPPPP